MLRTWITTTCEMLVGAVLIWAAIWKWTHPEQSVAFLSAVTSSNIPEMLIRAVALGEWGLGIWLFGGIHAGTARVLTGVLLISFTGLLLYASARGVEQSCGCLGLGESVRWSLARNAVLLLLMAIASAAALPSQRVTFQRKDLS